jgi:hypothetical protein
MIQKIMRTDHTKTRMDKTLEQFADALKSIGRIEKFDVVDLYHQKGMEIEQLVKFKRLKDPATGEYKNYKYPDYTTVPFIPGKDEYPYRSKQLILLTMVSILR